MYMYVYIWASQSTRLVFFYVYICTHKHNMNVLSVRNKQHNGKVVCALWMWSKGKRETGGGVAARVCTVRTPCIYNVHMCMYVDICMYRYISRLEVTLPTTSNLEVCFFMFGSFQRCGTFFVTTTRCDKHFTYICVRVYIRIKRTKIGLVVVVFNIQLITTIISPISYTYFIQIKKTRLRKKW